MSNNSLVFSPLSLGLEDLYHSTFNWDIYCDNIVGSMPTLRYFAAIVTSNWTLRHQVIWDYLIREYLAWKHLCRTA